MVCTPAVPNNIAPPYFNEFRFDKISWANNDRYTKEDSSEKSFPDYKTIQIPMVLDSELELAIENSSRLLSLEFGWDDDGALPIDKSNYRRAIKFLRDYENRIFENSKYKTHLTIPDIAPVKDGSIDLEWNLSNSYLLINFKSSNPNAAYFYGNFDGGLDINGKIETKEVSDKFANYLAGLS